MEGEKGSHTADDGRCKFCKHHPAIGNSIIKICTLKYVRRRYPHILHYKYSFVYKLLFQKLNHCDFYCFIQFAFNGKWWSTELRLYHCRTSLERASVFSEEFSLHRLLLAGERGNECIVIAIFLPSHRGTGEGIKEEEEDDNPEQRLKTFFINFLATSLLWMFFAIIVGRILI